MVKVQLDRPSTPAAGWPVPPDAAAREPLPADRTGPRWHAKAGRGIQGQVHGSHRGCHPVCRPAASGKGNSATRQPPLPRPRRHDAEVLLNLHGGCGECLLRTVTRSSEPAGGHGSLHPTAAITRSCTSRQAASAPGSTASTSARRSASSSRLSASWVSRSGPNSSQRSGSTGCVPTLSRCGRPSTGNAKARRSGDAVMAGSIAHRSDNLTDPAGRRRTDSCRIPRRRVRPTNPLATD